MSIGVNEVSSLGANHRAISFAAFSLLSLPWTRLFWIEMAKSPRMVPGRVSDIHGSYLTSASCRFRVVLPREDRHRHLATHALEPVRLARPSQEHGGFHEHDSVTNQPPSVLR